MSLYHEAAEVLTASQKKNAGSVKSIVFGRNSWKSDAKTLFAVATECAKWSEVLAEVIEKSGLLKGEKNLTPTLALLLVHDLFISKRGIALPATHGLNVCITRHKTRLSAELAKARIRRGYGSLDDLRSHVNAVAVAGRPSGPNGVPSTRHPRWIRINTLKTTVDDELKGGTFADWPQMSALADITNAPPHSRRVYVDKHIPNLIAIATQEEPTTYAAYKAGKLILQEKASCFPAYLLDPCLAGGEVMDACAAPGNKTTHVAAILGTTGRITACEKDPERSKTLQKMVKLAGADKIVTIKQKQDFTRLDPSSQEFANVTGFLLDPSCSGSGIFGRDEGRITVRLPCTTVDVPEPKSRKRKRSGAKQYTKPEIESGAALVEETLDDEEEDSEKLQTRLENLSKFQLRIVQHAMAFPAATRITYSTCSLYAEENEAVVVKALLSDIAVQRGWRVLSRSDQVLGMQNWPKRGSAKFVQEAVQAGDGGNAVKKAINIADVAEACIRCDKGGEDGTMGFFVVGFTRESHTNGSTADATPPGEEEGDEWNGFSEDRT